MGFQSSLFALYGLPGRRGQAAKPDTHDGFLPKELSYHDRAHKKKEVKETLEEILAISKEVEEDSSKEINYQALNDALQTRQIESSKSLQLDMQAAWHALRQLETLIRHVQEEAARKKIESLRLLVLEETQALEDDFLLLMLIH